MLVDRFITGHRHTLAKAGLEVNDALLQELQPMFWREAAEANEGAETIYRAIEKEGITVQHELGNKLERHKYIAVDNLDRLMDLPLAMDTKNNVPRRPGICPSMRAGVHLGRKSSTLVPAFSGRDLESPVVVMTLLLYGKRDDKQRGKKVSQYFLISRAYCTTDEPDDVLATRWGGMETLETAEGLMLNTSKVPAKIDGVDNYLFTTLNGVLENMGEPLLKRGDGLKMAPPGLLDELRLARDGVCPFALLNDVATPERPCIIFVVDERLQGRQMWLGPNDPTKATLMWTDDVVALLGERGIQTHFADLQKSLVPVSTT